MKYEQPKGELALRTLAMPADTNANGDIFGGWLVSQMDLAAGIMAKKCSKARTVTVAINQIMFKRAVQVGEMISIYCDITKIGRSSMIIAVQVWAIDLENAGDSHHVTEGVFTFVAVDEQGRPQAVKRN